YGGDPPGQTVVLEDLGDGDSPNTYDRVLGDDPQEAAAALLDHIRLTGQLHAATVGRQGDYVRIRKLLGPIVARSLSTRTPGPTPAASPFRRRRGNRRARATGAASGESG